MFVLHIALKPKSNSQANLEKTFLERFYPAISAQPGFVDEQLLRANDSDSDYCLCLSFDQQTSQQNWVATHLHQEVWPLLADLCESFSITRFTAV